MPGFYGADVAQLRTLAKQFDSGAQKLTTLTGQLSNSINSASAWEGGDADSFRRIWNGHDKAQLHAAIKSLRHGSKMLLANADQQQKASGGSGGSTGANGNFQTVWDTWGLARNLAGLGRSISALDDIRDWTKGISRSDKVIDLARGISKAGTFEDLVKTNMPYKVFTKADDILSLGKYGPALNVIGIGLDGYSAYQNYQEGDYGAMAYDGLKVALGVASFLPPPAGLVAMGASGVLALGELAWGAWGDDISEFASEAWDAGTEAVDDVVDAGKEFVDDVSDTVSDLTPW